MPLTKSFRSGLRMLVRSQSQPAVLDVHGRNGALKCLRALPVLWQFWDIRIEKRPILASTGTAIAGSVVVCWTFAPLIFEPSDALAALGCLSGEILESESNA